MTSFILKNKHYYPMNSGEFAHLERLSRADRCPGRDECQADKTLTHLPRDSAGGSAPGTAPLAHDARLTGSSGERNSGPTKICFPVSSGEETFSATPLAGNQRLTPRYFGVLLHSEGQVLLHWIVSHSAIYWLIIFLKPYTSASPTVDQAVE